MKGFTLIEMLIVIAIVGILAAVALPYYQGQAIRAKLTEVENAMANVKSAVSAFRHDTETWPDCPTINEVRNSLGVGLESVNRIRTISVNNNGEITVIVDNIDPIVNGKTLILRPRLMSDGSFTWNWDFSGDFPVHLRMRR